MSGSSKRPRTIRSEQRPLGRLAQVFADVEDCQTLLEKARWPEGVSCPRCRSTSICRLVTREPEHRDRVARESGESELPNSSREREPARKERHFYECGSCKHHFSVTSHTIFHRSHVPLRVWFMVIWKFTTSYQQMPAAWIVNNLGLHKRTARRMRSLIRRGMKEEYVRRLAGVIERKAAARGKSVPRS